MHPQYGYSDPFGRYYTKPLIGSLLVAQMPHINPRRMLDLGAGSGSLARAALQRWDTVELFTVDIDQSARGQLKRALGNGCQHEHIKADALSRSLPELLASKAISIDAAVCNPPFTTATWRPHFRELLEDAGFSSSYPLLQTIDTATLFLAQNLRVIDVKATLGIIVPDSLASSTKYRLFRRELLHRYELQRAVKLTRSSFRNTEALAHIMILSKAGPTNRPIDLSSITRTGTLRRLEIDRDEAIERLDFDYHYARKKSSRAGRQSRRLGLLVSRIQRGSLSSSESRALSCPVLHTSHMTPKNHGKWCDLRSVTARQKLPGLIRARPGDILLARVGRQLEHQVLGVRRGNPLITDCIYRVRVPLALRRVLLRELTSEHGRQWLTSRVYGVAARQLTKADLLDFPVPLTHRKITRPPRGKAAPSHG